MPCSGQVNASRFSASRDDRGTGDHLVARELYTADQTIVVRDAEGRPLWN